MAKMADVDFAFATGIDMSAGYAAANGTIAAGDSVEEAIQKLDGNQIDIISSLGVSQGDVDLGTFTGSTISDNITVKSALQELELALEGNIGNDVTPLTRTIGQLVASDPVNDNIDKLDTAIGADSELTPETRTTGGLTVDASNSVFLHIDNLDAAIGGDVTANTRTVGAISASNSINSNIEALDDALGSDSEITNPLLSTGNSVNQNLEALANAATSTLTKDAAVTLTTTDTAKVIYTFPVADHDLVTLHIKCIQATDGAQSEMVSILWDAANSEVDFNEFSILGETLFENMTVTHSAGTISVAVDSAAAHATGDADITVLALTN